MRGSVNKINIWSLLMKLLMKSCIGLLSLVMPLSAQSTPKVSPFHYPLHSCISQEEIRTRIHAFSDQLALDYADEEICIVAVLKGSLWFVTDLMRAMKTPATLATISCSSYGQNGTQAGELSITGLEKLDIKGKRVLVVDDICDTGATLTKLLEKLNTLSPKSIKTAVLLLKNTERSIGYKPDYYLFSIPDKFVVGYGLDFKEYYRGLPDIYELEYSE